VTGTSNNSAGPVVISWSNSSPPPNLHHYEIWRIDQYPSRTLVTTTTQANYSDPTAQAEKAYLYQVRAVDSAGQVLTISNWDLVTTVVLADDPLHSQITPIRAAHITDLRRAVDAVRALAVLSPPAVSWTDSNIAGQPLKAVYTEQLRSFLAEALTILDLPVPAWTDATLSGVQVKAVHLDQIRQAVK
jgi:hypothetical protein